MSRLNYGEQIERYRNKAIDEQIDRQRQIDRQMERDSDIEK